MVFIRGKSVKYYFTPGLITPSAVKKLKDGGMDREKDG